MDPWSGSAIIDASGGNNSTPFYFLTGLSAVSFCGASVFGVDLERSRREQEAFLVEEEKVRQARGVKFTEAEPVHVDVDVKA